MVYRTSKPLTNKEKKRLHEGFIQMEQVLVEDYKRERQRPSGLPKDWRNRVFK